MKTNEQLVAENRAIREMLASGPEARLLAIPGVLHVSVGLKEKDGWVTDQLCVRVYVREKKDRADVPAAELIPPEIDGVPTDVNTVVGFGPLADFTRERPLKGGIRITNRILGLVPGTGTTEFDAGTLGCIAIDNTDNSPVLLSNAHVLGAYSGAEGDRIYQPGPATFVSPLNRPITGSDLPLRPTDGTDAIARIKRFGFNNRADSAIATLNVSSCCNCCGLRYTNEIKGLSVDDGHGGRRPRYNTIVGHERAVSGMTVFKVGQLTGRTEGRVVDDNFPSFPVDFRQLGTVGGPLGAFLGGLQVNFIGQMVIVNADQRIPFAETGDSGAVIINLDNKIVGLLFAGGPGARFPVRGTTYPFITAANHISDVFSALNIRINYSPNVVTTSGAQLADVPPEVFEAPIPEPYRALRERLQRDEVTALLFALGQRHAEEVVRLVNHCRPVKVAWHRCHGPALLAAAMGAVRDGHNRLPDAVKGVTPREALERMRAVLAQHGSPGLRELMDAGGRAGVLRALEGCDDLEELIERAASDEAVAAVLGGAGA